MKTPLPLWIATILSLCLSGFSPGAEIPKNHPLGRYADLWTAPVFTIIPPAAGEEPAGDHSTGDGQTPTTPLPVVPAPKATLGLPRTSDRQAERRLEKFAHREALRLGLTVKRRKTLPTIATESGSHRARTELEVSGPERDLYQWLYILQDPNQFRGLTGLTINPNRAEIFNQVDAEGRLERSIRVQGRAEELNQVNAFNLSLKKSEALTDYSWATPPPVENPKNGQWNFVFGAVYDPR